MHPKPHTLNPKEYLVDFAAILRALMPKPQALVLVWGPAGRPNRFGDRGLGSRGPSRQGRMPRFLQYGYIGATLSLCGDSMRGSGLYR